MDSLPRDAPLAEGRLHSHCRTRPARLRALPMSLCVFAALPRQRPLCRLAPAAL